LPIVHTINEERCLLRIWWILLKGFRGYSRVPHQAFGHDSSHFEKAILTLCASNGPLFRRSPGPGKWWRLRAGHLLPEQNSDRAESQHNPIEKECLALVFTVQKIWHYLVGQTIRVISRVNPLRICWFRFGSINKFWRCCCRGRVSFLSS